MSIPLSKQVEKLFQDDRIQNEEQFAYKLKQLLFSNEKEGYNIKEPSNVIELLAENIIDIKNDNTSNLISTGYKNLDRIATFTKGELIVIGGRPGMGKTQLLVNLCDHISKTHPILYYTFDLSKELLSNRFLSFASEISLNRIITKRLLSREIKALINAANLFKTNQIHINDSGSQSISAIKNQCKKYVEEHGVKILVIDYIQLMSNRNYRQNRDMEISYICRELKNIAVELNICVIITSQLSRSVEMRGGEKRPLLSDLRDSGTIEQDADKVIFLYRPEYYNITEDYEGNDCRGVIELIVAKNKIGKIGNIKLRRDQDFIRFHDLDSEFESFNFEQNRMSELTDEYINPQTKTDKSDDTLPF